MKQTKVFLLAELMLQKITTKSIYATWQETGCRMRLSPGKARSTWWEEELGEGSYGTGWGGGGVLLFQPWGKFGQAQPGSLQKTREGRKEHLVKEKKRVGG